MFSQEDSHVSPTLVPGSDSARMTTDTSGLRCLEQLERFSLVGSWARTFAGLLIGTGEWSSTRCNLTWKLRATKSHRFYFQLVPWAQSIEETEFGLLPTVLTHDSKGAGSLERKRNSPELNDMAYRGLLPTPTTQEATSECQLSGSGRRLISDGKDTRSLNIGRMATMGLLPTPRAVTIEESTDSWDARKKRREEEGKQMPTPNLHQLAVQGMLPTPQASDKNMRWKTDNWEGSDLGSHINEALGTRSHLSPQFVLEMMGFPVDWTALPFQSGGTNP